MKLPDIIPKLDLDSVPQPPHELTHGEAAGWANCWAYIHQSDDYRQHLAASMKTEFPFLEASDADWEKAAAAILGRVSS